MARLWIIYQQKYSNNLIEMKRPLLGIILFLSYNGVLDPAGSHCRLLFYILKARWLQLPTISIINDFSSVNKGLECLHRILQ